MATENVTLYKGKKEALASTREGHLEKEYNIVADVTDKDGVRTVVLKLKDLSELVAKKKELVEVVAKALGEGRSKVFKEILLDSLGDYKSKDIERIHRKLVIEKRDLPIKAVKGCYEVIIGDGRRKDSDIISIRS